MTTFDDREAAFENKFAHDAATRFQLEARADKRLALWAGEKLGKSGADMERYIHEVIRADLSDAGSDEVIAKVAADLGSAADVATVRAAYEGFLSEARAALTKG